METFTEENEEVSGWKEQLYENNTQKFYWYISTLTEVFLNQTIINGVTLPHLLVV